jgi:thiol:disulfide interchange protein
MLCLVLSSKTYAITNDDVKLNIIPLYLESSNDQKIVNNFIINLELPEDWYTYYKNGGDAAFGPSLKIENLPQNIQLSELYFSTPTKEVDQGFASYIYKNKANFNFNLINDKNINLNLEKLNLNAELDFLVCKNICIPIMKKFTIESKFVKNITPNIDYFKFAEGFLTQKETLFDTKNGFLYIKISNNTKNALFIPNTEGLINDTANQETVTINKQAFLKVALDEYLEEEPIKISGIIKSDTENYNILADKNSFSLSSKTDYIFNLLIVSLFAFIGGLILNLMPCVLPVIGLKVFALLKHTTIKQRLKGALTYSAGVFVSMMIIVALLLALRSAGFELAWGFQLQNKYFVISMIIILMLISLNLLGLLKFGNGISGKANKLNMKYSNDFFTGFLTTLVATPCTAPFMATSLTFALTTNSNSITFIIFAFLALGISFPILLISIIPKTNKLLPKPGVWMNKLKEFLAFPILATIVWLIWVLDAQPYNITQAAFAVYIIALIVWIFTLSSKAKYLIIIVLLTLSSAFYYNYNKKEQQFLEFNKTKILELNSQGKNVLVDFTAKWCLTCQYNKAILHSTNVQQTLKQNNTVLMIADWTLQDKNITQELNSLGRSGVPTYAFYPANKSKPILLNEILTINTIDNFFKKD